MNHLCRLFFLIALLEPTFADEKLIESVENDPITRIAFGSCLKNPQEGLIMERIVEYKPDVFIWLGDNIYVDTNDKPERFSELYKTLGKNPRFQKLRKTCPNLAIWDDHDYGNNNRDQSYPLKKEAKQAFATFWKIPENSAVWKRSGIYRAHEYGPENQRVQIILLDGRWNLDKRNPKDPDSYLGAEQWAWLEKVLKRPARVRLICSGVQVVKINNVGKNWEMWGHHPTERARLFDLIETNKTNGVIFISGDMHVAEIFRTEDTIYPLYDVTASGMDVVHPKSGSTKQGPFEQVGQTLIDRNFGGIQINWAGDPRISLELIDGKGEKSITHEISLSEISY